MEQSTQPLSIVYVTPALYMAGGVERVLTLKANYLADHYGYDVTIVLTEGKDKPPFYPLSAKIKVVNLDLNFEELWQASFLKKIVIYLKKQHQFRKLLRKELMRLRPDITVSLLRREINFINSIKDGSRKIGELHINRANYRNYDAEGGSRVKRMFARWWSASLLSHLRQLDKLVVLTEKDCESWTELDNVMVIPDPLSFTPSQQSSLSSRRVVAVARYSHEKGIDLLLQAWAMVEKQNDDWQLDIYGDGDRQPYEQQANKLGIKRCRLHGRTNDVERAYCESSLFVLSSRFEGFGMVIVEAMACGLPVVAFDCPWGPRSIISNGEDGLLAENGNVADLSRQLLSLMNDPTRLTKMGAAAVRNVQRYRIERIAEQWKQLFETILDNKPKRA